MKSKVKEVFLLHYVYEYEDSHEDIVLVGVFSREKKAEKVLSELLKTPEFQDMSKCFEISKCEVNSPEWTEGYFTTD